MISAYDEMIEVAGKQEQQEGVEFLGVLRGQFDGILKATGLSHEREMDDVLRDVLSYYQRYQPNG